MTSFIKIEPGVCPYINEEDNCFYFEDYHSNQGYKIPVNSLIYNFKKEVDKKSEQLYYKAEAIKEIAALLCNQLKNTRENKSSYIFVPIPTSKNKNDELYDDRLIKVLEIVKNEIGISYCDILDQQSSNTPLHLKSTDRTPVSHKMSIDLDSIIKLKNKIVILFDDVVTTGSTYKAAKNLILSKLPDCKIVGLFIARAISYKKS